MIEPGIAAVPAFGFALVICIVFGMAIYREGVDLPIAWLLLIGVAVAVSSGIYDLGAISNDLRIAIAAGARMLGICIGIYIVYHWWREKA